MKWFANIALISDWIFSTLIIYPAVDTITEFIVGELLVSFIILVALIAINTD